MSFKLIREVWKISLKPAEKLVLLALADIVNDTDNNVCWPSQSALRNHTGMAERTIREAIKGLSESNYLTVEKHGRNRNKYTLLIRQNLPVSVRRNLPEINDPVRQILPDSAAKSAGLVRQNLPDHIKNLPIEPTKEPTKSSSSVDEPSEKKQAATTKKSAGKKAKRVKPQLPAEIMVLGERLAVCRTKDAGMLKTSPEAITYYADLVNTILKRGEVSMADMERVVAWFETPEGMESFHYGLGNMPRGYTHALIRNLPQYLSRARGETPQMHSGFVRSGNHAPVSQGFDMDILGSEWGNES